MKMKKYRLTSETITIHGHTLYRIEALRDFGDVKKGDKGGFVESEENLSHDGAASVCGHAIVYGAALVCDEARMCGGATLCRGNIICGKDVYSTLWPTRE